MITFSTFQRNPVLCWYRCFSIVWTGLGTTIETISVITVSYTHLDVYKRQVTSSSAFILSESSACSSKYTRTPNVLSILSTVSKSLVFLANLEIDFGITFPPMPTYRQGLTESPNSPGMKFKFKMKKDTGAAQAAVSYTHLDVYKRQGEGAQRQAFRRIWLCREIYLCAADHPGSDSWICI